MDRSRSSASRSRFAVLVTASTTAAALMIAALVALPAPAHALIPRVSACTPAGWSAPAVPRVDPDATDTLSVQASPQLRTDQPTWFCWGSCGNAAAGGGWTDALYLDGSLISVVGRPHDPRFVSHTFFSLNDGPVWVSGGRHTLMVHADLYGQMLDGPGDLGDDFAYVAYLWPAKPATWGVGQGVPLPPPPTTVYGGPPNCSAYSLQRPAIFPWCVSVTGSTNPSLILYDDYVNSTTGYSHQVGAAAPAGDTLDLVVGQGDPTPDTLYAGLAQGPEPPPSYPSCTLYSSDASGHVGTAGSLWPSVALPAGAVGQVFRLTLQAGNAYPLLLSSLTGTADLAFALFPPGSGGVFTLKDAIAYSVPRTTTLLDSLVFVPPATGDYPLVVYRVTRAGLDAPTSYSLQVGTATLGAPVIVPEPALSLELLGASPNPVRGAARLAFSLPSAGHVTLALHDVQGRRVRTLVDVELPAGSHAVSWDGRDDAGVRVPAGSYWMKLVTADGDPQPPGHRHALTWRTLRRDLPESPGAPRCRSA